MSVIMPQRNNDILGLQKNIVGDYRHYRSKRDSIVHSVRSTISVVFVGLLFGLYVVVYQIDAILPTALTAVDEKTNQDAFIAENAQSYLKTLTEIGPRIIGTHENEVLAMEFLKNQIALIQKQAQANQHIEIDTQIVSGSYFIDYNLYGTVNIYANVQNVIVKLHSRNNSEHSLLVNAHFDSVSTSPGASDDGINCAVMLELLRKLSQSPKQLENNVIFLFNGAEETLLQASHGFITQHKWAKEVRVVINLEAAGTGGKEILFQSGPNQPWLLKYYKNVPHPNGQVAGEEIFHSGFIPSDTDFRIFKDFGNVIGMDFAFNRDGYRYHTRHDGFVNIPLGSYQHIGDNMLTLIRNLVDAPELVDPLGQPSGQIVFYDFLGLFVISYSQTIAVIINIIVSVLSLAIALKAFYDFQLGICRPSLIYLGFTFGAILSGWIASAFFIFVLAVIIDALQFSLSWYNHQWIIFGLYVTPAMIFFNGSIVLLNYLNRKVDLNPSIHAQIQAHVLQIIWTVFLLFGTILGFRSVYVILIPIVFQTLTFFIIQAACLHYSMKVRKWQIIYILGTVIPSMFLMKQALEIISVFVPVCGRMGSLNNPEIIIGFLAFFLTILITSYYAPLITLVQKPQVLLGSLTVIFFTFFIIVFTPLGFPYSGNLNSPAPQRFWIYHTSRIVRNEKNDVYKKDAGFFLLNMDRNSPHSIQKYVKDINNAKSVVADCDSILFCGFPIASTNMIAVLRESTWIPAEEPFIPEPINLTLNSKINVTITLTRFNFTARGPNHLSIYISPRFKISLTNISLTTKPPRAIQWNGRPTYVIMYTWGKERAPLTFSVDFKKPVNWSEPIFDIALAGKYMNDRTNLKTLHYTEFLSEFPSWTDTIALLGNFESWVY